ncbi:hypothetical protein HDV00_003769 [Rhizophlyctis rosea]|nr:hypothetical protein HDV00_003769 [Rhizophlyctis rosea]
MANPKTTLSILSDRGFDHVAVMKDALNKELRSTALSIPLRDWCQLLSKRTLGEREFGKLTITGKPPCRKPLVELCSDLQECDRAKVASLGEQWISAPSGAIDWGQQFASVDVDRMIDETLGGIGTSLQKKLAHLCLLPSHVQKEKNTYILAAEDFQFLVCGDARPLPKPSPLKTWRDAALEADSIKELLGRQEQKHRKILYQQVESLWGSSRAVLQEFAKLDAVGLPIRNLKQDRGLSESTISFGDFWAKNTDQWKKKGRKGGSQPTVEDADGLFSTWMGRVIAHFEKFETETVSTPIRRFTTAFVAFREKTLPILLATKPNCPFAASRVREALGALTDAETDLQSTVDFIRAKIQSHRDFLIAQLVSFKSSFENSTNSALGRMERCASHEWQARVKDFDVRQRKILADLLERLHQLTTTSAPVKAALLSVTAILAAGEAKESTLLREYRIQMTQDTQLQDLITRSSELKENLHNAVQYCQSELGRIVAKLLLEEAERIVSLGVKGPAHGANNSSQSSKGGKKKHKKKGGEAAQNDEQSIVPQNTPSSIVATLTDDRTETPSSNDGTNGTTTDRTSSDPAPADEHQLQIEALMADNLTLRQQLADESLILDHMKQQCSKLSEENKALRDEANQLRNEVGQLREAQRNGGIGNGNSSRLRGWGREREGKTAHSGFHRYGGSTIRCSNCWAKDHQSADCKAACRYCDVNGHLGENCPNVLVL